MTVLVDKHKIDILANAIADKSGEPVTMTLDEMVRAVDGIVAGGGDENVIETVKVNGTALTVSNKAVDIPVPTTVAELSDSNNYLMSTNLEIGEKDFSSTSLTSGTAKSMTASSGNAYLTIPAGKWFVAGMVRFNSNATGRRECWLSTTNNGTTAIMQQAKAIIPAANGDQTFVHFSFATTLTSSANYYLVAKQNSGSNINALGYVKWFGIKS